MEDEERLGFWKRQFAGAPTRLQTLADLLLGILLPVLCLIYDPVVFHGPNPVVSHYRWLAYGFIGAEIVVLACWHLMRRSIGRSAVFFVGPLLAGGIFSLALGLVLLPLTLIGMLFVIGFLGLTPFLVSLVFFRNGVRALRRSGDQFGRAARLTILIAGVLFVGTPSLAILHFRYHQTLPQFLEAARSGHVELFDDEPVWRD
jgi:hypothetical protein